MELELDDKTNEISYVFDLKMITKVNLLVLDCLKQVIIVLRWPLYGILLRGRTHFHFEGPEIGCLDIPRVNATNGNYNQLLKWCHRIHPNAIYP